jgi:hypothetical protein
MNTIPFHMPLLSLLIFQIPSVTRIWIRLPVLQTGTTDGNFYHDRNSGSLQGFYVIKPLCPDTLQKCHSVLHNQSKQDSAYNFVIILFSCIFCENEMQDTDISTIFILFWSASKSDRSKWVV